MSSRIDKLNIIAGQTAFALTLFAHPTGASRAVLLILIGLNITFSLVGLAISRSQP